MLPRLIRARAFLILCTRSVYAKIFSTPTPSGTPPLRETAGGERKKAPAVPSWRVARQPGIRKKRMEMKQRRCTPHTYIIPPQSILIRESSQLHLPATYPPSPDHLPRGCPPRYAQLAREVVQSGVSLCRRPSWRVLPGSKTGGASCIPYRHKGHAKSARRGRAPSGAFRPFGGRPGAFPPLNRPPFFHRLPRSRGPCLSSVVVPRGRMVSP